jgi:hypothetical protein
MQSVMVGRAANSFYVNFQAQFNCSCFRLHGKQLRSIALDCGEGTTQNGSCAMGDINRIGEIASGVLARFAGFRCRLLSAHKNAGFDLELHYDPSFGERSDVGIPRNPLIETVAAELASELEQHGYKTMWKYDDPSMLIILRVQES